MKLFLRTPKMVEMKITRMRMMQMRMMQMRMMQMRMMQMRMIQMKMTLMKMTQMTQMKLMRMKMMQMKNLVTVIKEEKVISIMKETMVYRHTRHIWKLGRLKDKKLQIWKKRSFNDAFEEKNNSLV